MSLSRKAMVAGLVLVVGVGAADAGRMLVRVKAPDYRTLREHISFKGTSIDIAGTVAGESYDLMLERSDLPAVRASGLPLEVLVDDLDTYRREFELDAFYCTYDSMVGTMRRWAQNYPTLCRLDSIGQTYLGRWIYAVKLSDNVSIQEDEPEVLLEALHHSREWACPQAARHFCDTLLSNYATNSAFRDFLDNHQVWVVPMVNVDGYDYDYPSARWWRRNRKPYGGEIGCDVNRNYNGACDTFRFNAWGALVPGAVSTHMPGDDTWMGAFPFWANCVDALSDFFKQHTFVADISLHSSGELVLWPFGSGVAPYDLAMVSGLAQAMASRMSRLSGGTYTPEQTTGLYPVSGGSTDWMYGWAHNVGGFPCMSYVFEIGTEFYQNLSDVDAIEREVFDGAYYLFTHADSIINVLEGEVPPPVLAPIGTSATGDFTLHWTPVRPEHNHPDRWEVEELSGLTVLSEDFESGTTRWELGGFTRSTTQKHSGSYSMFSGSADNMASQLVTRDPYPVAAGDSLAFWVWYDLENNYDVFVTEVSENGLEWLQLHDRYTGNSSGWQRKAFSLAPWAGRSVFLRFRSMTDDNTLRNGAYVDDVQPVAAFAGSTVLSDNVLDTLYEVTGRTVGQYWYRVRGHNAAWAWNNQGPLEDVDVTGTGIAAGPERRAETRFTDLGPNPAAGGVTVGYSLAARGPLSITIYDASGRQVRTLESGMRDAGTGSTHWDGRDERGRRFAAGVYYCRLAADRVLTARLVLAD